MHWGTASWTLLHALCCTLPNHSSSIIWLHQWLTDLVSVIPCPECRSHAMRLLASRSLPTYDLSKLKDALCHFHNAVNHKAGKPLFPRAMYDSAHNRGSIHNKIICFAQAMQRSTRGKRDFAEGLARRRKVARLVHRAWHLSSISKSSWFKAEIQNEVALRNVRTD